MGQNSSSHSDFLQPQNASRVEVGLGKLSWTRTTPPTLTGTPRSARTTAHWCTRAGECSGGGARAVAMWVEDRVRQLRLRELPVRAEALLLALHPRSLGQHEAGRVRCRGVPHWRHLRGLCTAATRRVATRTGRRPVVIIMSTARVPPTKVLRLQIIHHLFLPLLTTLPIYCINGSKLIHHYSNYTI
jgi:hypothetical protein